MAIKEFIIGPQNYFEEGYFDGDYTLPNVSKSFLECDIDNIRGGRVVTGLYYEDNFIDGTYYHDNSIRAILVAEAMVVQEASVSLQSYYQEGYYQTGYYEQRGSQFILTAELTLVGEYVFASGTWQSQCTINIDAIKTVNVTTSLNLEFIQTAIGLRDRDIDLFAFSDAAIAIQVNLVRDTNIQMSVVFDIATDGRRFRDLSAEENSLFNFDVINERSRETSIETQAAFSISIIASSTKLFDSIIISNSSIDVNSQRIRNNNSNTETNFELSAIISHIEGADIVVNNFAEISCIIDNLTKSASIDSTAIVNIAIDASRVRYINAAKESLFNFDAVVERSLRGFQSQTQAAFSLSAEANPNTKQATIALQSQFTQQSAGGFTFEYSANLTAFARIQTSRTFGSGRPRDLDDNFGNFVPSFDNSIKKFGTHSLLGNRTSGSTAIFDSSNPGIVPRQSEDFYYEGWIYPKNLTVRTGFQISNFFAIRTTDTGRFEFEGRTRNLNNPDGTVSAYLYTHSSQFIANAWHHLAVVKQSNSISYYINGTRVYNYVETNPTTPIVPFNPWSTTNNTTRDEFVQALAIDGANIDEVMFVKGNTLGLSTSQTTIPVPTEPRTNSIAGVEFLYHFDNNVLDDIFLTQTVSASLTSTASITAKLSGPEKASANLTSITTLNATISHIEGVDLSAFANASLTASAINLRGFESLQQSEFAVSVDAIKVTDANSSISADNTIIINNERIRDNAVATESVATQLSAVVRLAGLFADDISVFQMSIQAVKTTDTQSNQSANFTQSTNNFRVRFNQADLSSQFTKTSDVFVGKVGQANITAEFAQSTITSRIRDNTISANSISTVECIANNLGKIEGSLFNQASMSITAVKTVFVQSLQTVNTQLTAETQNSVVRDYSATITSSCNVSANAVKNIGTFAFLTAFASNLTVAVKDVVSDCDMTVIASMSIDAVKTVNTISNLNTVIQQQTAARKTAVGILSANSEFTQDTNAITVLNAHADFDSISSTLAAVVKIGDFFVNADVVANADINGTVIRSAQSQNSAQSQLAANFGVIKQGITLASVNSTIAVQPFKVVNAVATISSAMVFAAEVREIHIEEIVYVIPAEIWEYEIYPETREYAIGSETREYIIT